MPLSFLQLSRELASPCEPLYLKILNIESTSGCFLLQSFEDFFQADPHLSLPLNPSFSPWFQSDILEMSDDLSAICSASTWHYFPFSATTFCPATFSSQNLVLLLVFFE